MVPMVPPRRPPATVIAVGPRPAPERMGRIQKFFSKWGFEEFVTIPPLALMGLMVLVDQVGLSERVGSVEVVSRSMTPAHVTPYGRRGDGQTGEVTPDAWFVDIRDPESAGDEGMLGGKTFRMEVSRKVYDMAGQSPRLQIQYEVTRVNRQILADGVRTGSSGPFEPVNREKRSLVNP